MSAKETNTTQTFNQSTYYLSLAVAILLTAGITAIVIWFFAINTVHDFRGTLIEDLRATAVAAKVK